eukprot:TRINITY_DN5557_c0_g1_i3.p1 TRINITY_DN5557_c0_g1~~TRINITY_DN5557_c0_g1_i3.p1  ORF type:complete len:356 (-),score=47.01 TRINITY_DN5557_c0_g1_i3:775-1842(-)
MPTQMISVPHDPNRNLSYPAPAPAPAQKLTVPPQPTMKKISSLFDDEDDDDDDKPIFGRTAAQSQAPPPAPAKPAPAPAPAPAPTQPVRESRPSAGLSDFGLPRVEAESVMLRPSEVEEKKPPAQKPEDKKLLSLFKDDDEEEDSVIIKPPKEPATQTSPFSTRTMAQSIDLLAKSNSKEVVSQPPQPHLESKTSVKNNESSSPELPPINKNDSVRQSVGNLKSRFENMKEVHSIGINHSSAIISDAQSEPKPNPKSSMHGGSAEDHSLRGSVSSRISVRSCDKHKSFNSYILGDANQACASSGRTGAERRQILQEASTQRFASHSVRASGHPHGDADEQGCPRKKRETQDGRSV